MKPFQSIAAPAALLLVAGGAAQALTDDAVRAAPTQPLARQITQTRAIDSILDAPDASSAVEAYSRARAALPGRTSITKAYVRRMTELGQPQMAESQAREVLESDLGDGLSQAVLAAGRARNSDMERAIAGIASACTNDPDEPFVQRTAGQILAWLDTRSGRMAEDIESTAQRMRSAVGRSPEFMEAYRKARDSYVAARIVSAAKPEPVVVTKQPVATLVSDAIAADYEDEPILYTTGSVLWSADWCGSSFSRTSCAPVWGGRVRSSGSCYPSWSRRSSCAPVYLTFGTRTTPLGHYSTSWGRSVPAYSRGGYCVGTRSYSRGGGACAPARSHCR